MDWEFLVDVFWQLLSGLPLTIQLATLSLILGGCLAIIVAAAAAAQSRVLRYVAYAHIEVFRGTPLLVQIFLIYYGLGQINALQHSFLWPYLRQPYWCAILALALNTSAYTAEIIRGALQAVPPNEIEAARACGMSGFLLRRRIIWPIALRYGLPVYSSEVIMMIKATSLASIITLGEVTGIAYKLISSTYRVFEIFAASGIIYLALTFGLSTILSLLEKKLQVHRLGLTT